MKEKHLVILATSDIHSNFCGTDYKTGKRNKDGGLLKAADYINKTKSRYKNVLLLDAGDAFQNPDIPSGFYLAYPSMKHTVYTLMKGLGYNAAALGNHDFDLGAEALKEINENAAFPLLCANALNSDGTLFTGRAYSIFTLSGIRTAVIGVVTPFAASRLMEKVEGVDEICFTDPSIAVKKAVSEVKDKADLCVVLAHMDPFGEIDPDKGSDSALHIAEENGEVDILVCAHTHMSETGMVKNAIYAECTDGVRQLIRFDIDFDNDNRVIKKEVRLIGAEELCSVSEAKDFPETESLCNCVGRYLASRPHETDTSEIIGFANYDYYSYEPISTTSNVRSLHELLCLAFTENAKSETAVIGHLSKDAVFLKGPVSEKMAEAVFPFPDYLCAVKLSGKEFLELWNSFSDTFFFSGITKSEDTKEFRDGKRAELFLNGKELRADSSVTLCVSNFILNTVFRKKGFIKSAPVYTSSDGMQNIFKDFIRNNFKKSDF